MRKPAWFTAGIVAVALVFQFFLRYDYVHLAGARVMRIDRLSGASCDMPCLPAPPTSPPTPRPTATPFDRLGYALEFGDKYSLAKQRAIRIAQSQPLAATVIASNPDNKWSAQNGVDDLILAVTEMTPAPNASPVSMPPTLPTPHPVLLVCYCNKKGFGFRWEVHTNTGEAFYANDNADLRADAEQQIAVVPVSSRATGPSRFGPPAYSGLARTAST